MFKSVAVRAFAFAAGVFLLEGTSSFVHVLVLKDIPADLAAKGVDLWWMLSRDVLLSVLGGVAFALAVVFGPKRPFGLGATVIAGFVFALLLEGLNWVIPNSLLAPSSALQGVVAWGYFVGGAWAAAFVLRRLVARGA